MLQHLCQNVCKMDYRSDLQESLDYYDDGYRLKTNEEIAYYILRT